MTAPVQPLVRKWISSDAFVWGETGGDSLTHSEAKREHNAVVAAYEADRAAINEARGHLGAALAQVAPSDDQIIIGHMRDAYRLLGGKP